MAEALDRVKEAFGKDAVVLSTRSSDRSGVLGLGGRSYVEITAARDISDLPPSVRPTTLRVKSGATKQADGAAEIVNRPRTADRTSASIEDELGNLKTMVTELMLHARRTSALSAAPQPSNTPTVSVPPELLDFHRRLVQHSVAEELAASLVRSVRDALRPEQLLDPRAVDRQLADRLEPMIPTAGGISLDRNPGRPTIVALVGPTGVGKTTTVAKLAANYSLRERRRVGMITIDTYRIAAIEQLRTYAQIMDIPLAVAATPSQLSTAIADMRDRELILIDTAGRGQRDAEKIEELNQYFQLHHPDELHLVLAGTASERVLHQAIEKFGRLGVDRVIFTKLDEALGFGVILSCLQKANAKLSYVTTGQGVPEDIEIGTGGRVAQCIVKGAFNDEVECAPFAPLPLMGERVG